MIINEEVVQWNPSNMVEVVLNNSDDFLKIKETLTRIGIPSVKNKILYQSCHILHKQEKYFIVHFKELFAIDGKETNISVSDLERRNAIVQLLEDWGLLKIVNKNLTKNAVSLSTIKILTFKDKDDWELFPKYTIGKKKHY